MSRLGKKTLMVPDKTEVSISENIFVVKGPLGEISKKFDPMIDIKVVGKEITLAPVRKSIQSDAMWGTYASHINNMIKGVTTLFVKKLIIEGIGFKSEVKADKLVLALGFYHPVIVSIPEGLKVTADKNIITVSGVDKELVGGFSANVRSLKKPEPYKGKGIRYEDEVIKRKQGKKSA